MEMSGQAHGLQGNSLRIDHCLSSALHGRDEGASPAWWSGHRRSQAPAAPFHASRMLRVLGGRSARASRLLLSVGTRHRRGAEPRGMHIRDLDLGSGIKVPNRDFQ
jgi:hypothetical protein